MYLAGIDSLIPLLVFIGVAILSAVLKKKPMEEEPPPPLPRGGTPPRRTKSWEEELRDLLKSQLPQPAPPRMPQQKAPPPVPQQRRPQPARPATAIEPAFQPLRGLSESDQRYASAADLEQRVARHMESVTTQHVKLTRAERHDVRSAHEAIALVRDLRSARSAVLASVILGPPKSLES